MDIFLFNLLFFIVYTAEHSTTLYFLCLVLILSIADMARLLSRTLKSSGAILTIGGADGRRCLIVGD